MLELNFLREQREEAEQRLTKRNIDAKALLDTARTLDDARRATQTELDARLNELNGLSRTTYCGPKRKVWELPRWPASNGLSTTAMTTF